MNDTTTGSEEYMTLKEYEALNDDNNVATLDEWERGPTTVEFGNVRHKINIKLNDGIGDDDSTLFFSCEDGELEIGYDPQFDAPIVTNAKKGQLKLALRELTREAGYDDVDVLFDDAGPLVLRSGGMMTVTTPMKYPWQHGPQTKCPRTPCGPSIRGSSDE